MAMANNYDALKSAVTSLEIYCGNHEDCEECNLDPLCSMLPVNLSRLLNGIAENKEKGGEGDGRT